MAINGTALKHAESRESKIKKLPFVIAPKEPKTELIGNEEIGQIAIAKYNKILPLERKFIKDSAKHLPDIRKEALKMAREISEQSGKKIKDVYEALSKGDTEFLGEYAEQVFELQSILEESKGERELISVTAILKYRIDNTWTIEDSEDPSKLPPGLLDSLYKFFLLEQEAENIELETNPEDSKKVAEESTQA